MHEGCSGVFESGKHVVDKVRAMGFNKNRLPTPLEIKCKNCSTVFQMLTIEFKCPKCQMVYAVTPCHATKPGDVMPAGIGY